MKTSHLEHCRFFASGHAIERALERYEESELHVFQELCENILLGVNSILLEKNPNGTTYACFSAGAWFLVVFSPMKRKLVTFLPTEHLGSWGKQYLREHEVYRESGVDTFRVFSKSLLVYILGKTDEEWGVHLNIPIHHAN